MRSISTSKLFYSTPARLREQGDLSSATVPGGKFVRVLSVLTTRNHRDEQHEYTELT